MNNDLDDELDQDENISSDDQTMSMFADAPAAQTTIAPASSQSAYLVLARKYRPHKFEDLIGQEAMVKTLINAFSQNRIAHGFMLTGVRGVGKTTTARLIARALNYSAPDNDAPSMMLDVNGIHCDAINQGRHPDVIELDAATNTQVDKMRDLLENARYGPISARYKIYIIDEVHMLSTHSFNALLKTLEEPPPHIKFIFATTETHKVPVTILSRCQRFDLRRVERGVLADHLENVCNKENRQVAREGLEQIARAAEGSVRDALSLLDQALVQKTENGEVSADSVRSMLGLSDRNRIYDLLGHIFTGNTKAAMLELKAQYDLGADPTNILSTLMELCHEIAKQITLGDAYKEIETGDGLVRLKALGANTTVLALSRLWQMLLLGLEETRRAPDALQAADICLLRLCGIQSLPPPEDLVRTLNGESVATQSRKSAPNGENNGATSLAISQVDASIEEVANDDFANYQTGNSDDNLNQSNMAFATYEDILAAIEERGNRALVMDLERYVMPVRLEQNIFAFEPAKGAPKSLQQDLLAALQSITYCDWKVYVEVGGGQTIEQKRKLAQKVREDELKQLPNIAALFRAFPGAKITKINSPSPNEENQPKQQEV